MRRKGLGAPLGSTIRKIRRSKGIKGYELAEAAGLDPAYVSLIENERVLPVWDALRRIAIVLDLPEPVAALARALERKRR